jgi:hypothetical protein
MPAALTTATRSFGANSLCLIFDAQPEVAA